MPLDKRPLNTKPINAGDGPPPAGGDVRDTQDVLEVLGAPQANALVTHDAAEVLAQGTGGEPRTTQDVVEILAEALPGNLLVTQDAAEVLVTGTVPQARVTQDVFELLAQPIIRFILATQDVIEILAQNQPQRQTCRVQLL